MRIWVTLMVAGVLAGPAVGGGEPVGRLLDAFEDWKPVTQYVLPDWRRIEDFGEGRLKMSVTRSAGARGGKWAMRIVSENPNRYANPGFAVKTIKSAKDWASFAGISFWLKGDGSRNYASMVLGVNGAHPLKEGYEAFFPLADKQWHKVTLRWEEFVQNTWFDNKAKSPITVKTLRIDPTQVREIGFGHGPYFIFDDAAYAMEIEDLQLEKTLPEWKVPPTFSTGLSRTKELLASGKPLKIMVLGDSITYSAKDKTYAHLMIPKIKDKFGSIVTVTNQAIGGFSVRGGAIILPRALLAMPDPDLVLIYFGANDIRLVMDPSVFAAQIGDLVDRIRIGTNGKADVLVLSGTPRGEGLDVGKIVAGTAQAAEAKQTGYCDTYPVFKAMSPAEFKVCVPDGTHLGPTGQAKIAQLAFDKICWFVGEPK